MKRITCPHCSAATYIDEADQSDALICVICSRPIIYAAQVVDGDDSYTLAPEPSTKPSLFSHATPLFTESDSLRSDDSLAAPVSPHPRPSPGQTAMVFIVILALATTLTLSAAWLGALAGPTVRAASAGPAGSILAYLAILSAGGGLLVLIGSHLNLARLALEQHVWQGLLVLFVPLYAFFYAAAHWPDNDLTTYLLLSSLIPTSLGLTICAITFA